MPESRVRSDDTYYFEVYLLSVERVGGNELLLRPITQHFDQNPPVVSVVPSPRLQALHISVSDEVLRVEKGILHTRPQFS